MDVTQSLGHSTISELNKTENLTCYSGSTPMLGVPSVVSVQLMSIHKVPTVRFSKTSLAWWLKLTMITDVSNMTSIN